MNAVAILFPGQGSQSVGMMREFAEQYPLVEERFQQASEIVGIDLWDICQHDTNARLSQTAFTQPILLTAGYVAYEVLRQEAKIEAKFMAGHSLGEYTALLASGAMTFAEAVYLVHKRGELMQSAVGHGQGAMAAIIGLDEKQINALCAQVAGEVYPANYNTAEQIVISGHSEAVEAAVVQAKEVGAKRALMLPVSVPSHCPLMRPAAASFSLFLDRVKWKKPNSQIIYNVDGNLRHNRSGMKAALGAQLYQPVLWQHCIQQLKELGAKTFIEVGPGKVLTGLNKRIVPNLTSVAFNTPSALDAVKSAIEGQ